MLHPNVIYLKGQTERGMAEIALQYNSSYNELLLSFANNVNTPDGGTHEEGFKNSLTRVFNDYGRSHGLLKDKDENLSGADVREGLICVISVKLQEAEFEGQTKAKLGSSYMRALTLKIVTDGLTDYLEEHPKPAREIVKKAQQACKARNAARKAREATRRKSLLETASLPGKLADCSVRDAELTELFIVEGDSAAGAIRTSRDAEFQGVMPVRGKILNCLKEDYPRIFKSDIIMDLMRVLGCGVEIKDKRIKNLGAFDLDNLNWNKVIICTDADVDGYHIRTLVLTMLYRLVPTLIDEGYVYIAESPLYEINCKEKTYFAYTELEKNGILKEIGDQKCSINRSKGLGENDPDMMWLTTMNPETRRLIKVEPEDVTKMETMFNLLLGNDEAGRKRHISEHGKEYLDQLDLQ